MGPYKSYAMGSLENVLIMDFVRVISFLSYADFEQMRNTCWFLHNFTKRYRTKWAISPMRAEKCAFVVYGFLKWARFTGGLSLDRADRLAAIEEEAECASSNLGPFVDEYGKLVCMAYLEGKCGGRSCPQLLSHDPIFLVAFDLNKQGVFIEERGVMIAVSQLFGPEFEWRYQWYIKALFKALSTMREVVTRVDPMTRKFEIVRKTVMMTVNVIGYSDYLELMTLCEEAYSGVKGFRKHPIFIGRAVRRFNDPAEPFDLDNLGCILCNDDTTAQYSKGINVPWKKSKMKRLKSVKVDRVFDKAVMSKRDIHIELYRHKTEEVSALIDKLFL